MTDASGPAESTEDLSRGMEYAVAGVTRSSPAESQNAKDVVLGEVLASLAGVVNALLAAGCSDVDFDTTILTSSGAEKVTYTAVVEVRTETEVLDRYEGPRQPKLIRSAKPAGKQPSEAEQGQAVWRGHEDVRLP